MDPKKPESDQTSSSEEQSQQLPRPSASLLRWLKDRLEDMDCGPEGYGEIWLVDDTTGEVLDRAAVRKREKEEDEA